MKKERIISIIISLIMLMLTSGVYADGCACDDQEIHRTKEDAIETLKIFDIVRNTERWTCGDPITRRDAFKMTYVLVSKSRRYVEDTPEAIKELFDLRDVHGSLWGKFIFEDIAEGEEDYLLAASLVFWGILSGKEVDGHRYASFDDYLTYEEAASNIIRTLCFSRITNDDFLNEYLGENYEGNRYFGFLEKAGLINHNAYPDRSGLVLEEGQIHENISAYDYMFLLYRSMFIPVDYNYAPPTLLNYRIEHYVDFSQEEISGNDIVD